MPYKPKKWQATNIFIKANKEIDYEKIEAKRMEMENYDKGDFPVLPFSPF